MYRSNVLHPLSALVAAVATIGSLLVLTLGVSGPVGAASVESTGWAWASQPTVSAYDAPPSYSYNSEGLTNRIERRGVGLYTVAFTGLYRDDFEVQVVAYGDGSTFCGLDGNVNSGTSVAGSDLHLFVRCLDATDLEPTDSRFVASMTGQDGPSSLQGAGVRFGFNDGWDGYNSSGGGFVRTRVSPGTYDVRIEGQSAIGANVQVTAVNPSPFGQWCNVGNWRQSGADVVVRVKCWTVQWPSDARFHLRFSTQGPGDLGYAWANRSTTAAYTPSTSYQWQGSTGSTAGAQATRSGTGRYTLGFPDVSGTPSTAMVTAYGFDLTRCVIAGWTSFPVTVRVRCVDAVANEAIDSRYTGWVRVAADAPQPVPDTLPIREVGPVQTVPSGFPGPGLGR